MGWGEAISVFEPRQFGNVVYFLRGNGAARKGVGRWTTGALRGARQVWQRVLGFGPSVLESGLLVALRPG